MKNIPFIWEAALRGWTAVPTQAYIVCSLYCCRVIAPPVCANIENTFGLQSTQLSQLICIEQLELGMGEIAIKTLVFLI